MQPAEPSEAQDHVAWQLERFAEQPDGVALVWREAPCTFGELTRLHREWLERLRSEGVEAGAPVCVVGDYSPASVACLLALIQLGAIVVPLARESRDQHEEFQRIAEVAWRVELHDDGGHAIQRVGEPSTPALYAQLSAVGDAGLVVFTSGSTGEPKAIVHSFPRLLAKFRRTRRAWRTINFLLFDHLGGINTLLGTLGSLGCTIVPKDRTVAGVCEAIQSHRVELLPTSPSFLNLMLLQDAPAEFDLSSLELITYGTEVMPERTLALAIEALPRVRFQQTYGLSELGVMRSQSKSNESLFVRIGGEGFETKVVDGTLRIRSPWSMIGYLNAPDPFDADGWFDTGDAVIQEGDFYRILGRESEVINVGGQKIYPAEVEKVLLDMPGVVDVTVRGEEHLILGHIVAAMFQLEEPVPATELKRRVVAHCKGRLQRYMVPAKVESSDESSVNYRFKKIRR